MNKSDMKSGFFLIDKPSGMTSHDVVSRMRKILNMKKVGHSGTLDPMATGVMVIGFGTSTRLLDYVQSGSKEYLSNVYFGASTNTGDSDGEIISIIDMGALTLEDIERATKKFVGDIEQIPPMVSAIKVKGKKLYEYEREGLVVERKPRKVFIESIEVSDVAEIPGENAATAFLRVVCSPGTYIRTLAEDIASELGGVAHLTSLKRTKNGNVRIDQCLDLETLKNLEDPFEKMTKPYEALSHLVQIELSDEQTLAVSHGKELVLNELQEKVISNANGQYFVVKGETPRELIAVYLKDAVDGFRSRCVVFTDDSKT